MINYEEIKQRLSIANVLDYYGIRYPSGNKVMINCCFHDDRTPSLQVDKVKNLFHCFGGGCGARGSVIDFVMRMENLECKEASIFICENILGEKVIKQGCEGTRERKGEGAKGRNCNPVSLNYAATRNGKYKKETWNEDNIEVYREIYKMTELTGQGKTYLREERGFCDETVMKYGLRSIDSPGKIFGGLKAKFGVERLRKAGLLTSKGGFLFWGGGILIPYWVNGEIIYFQYRLFKPYNKIKYLFLSGLRKEYYLGNIWDRDCFVFEGVFDALAFYEITGEDNFIAVGGTGEFEQEKILGYIADIKGKSDVRLIFCPDEDVAGISAVKKEATKQGIIAYRVKKVCEKLGIVCDEKMDWNDVLVKII